MTAFLTASWARRPIGGCDTGSEPVHEFLHCLRIRRNTPVNLNARAFFNYHVAPGKFAEAADLLCAQADLRERGRQARPFNGVVRGTAFGYIGFQALWCKLFNQSYDIVIAHLVEQSWVLKKQLAGQRFLFTDEQGIWLDGEANALGRRVVDELVAYRV